MISTMGGLPMLVWTLAHRQAILFSARLRLPASHLSVLEARDCPWCCGPKIKNQIYTSSIPGAIIYGAKIWIGVWKSNTDLPPIRFFTSSIPVTQWVIQNCCGFPNFCWWLKGEKSHEKHPKLTCSKVGGLHHLPSIVKLNSHWISGICIYIYYKYIYIYTNIL